MKITTGNIRVLVELPVQFRAVREGTVTTAFDIRVGGLVSLYDALDATAKADIARQVAAAASAQDYDDWK